jgi:hypothetical protein
MLESASLLLLPWTFDRAEQVSWVRSIRDGATEAPLGVVRCAAKRRSWLAWFQSYRLDVLETEDEALLLTLVRSWGLLRLWDLYDAEENRIGSIYPPVLLDRDGVRRGYIQVASSHQAEVIGVDAARLADMDIDATQGLRLRFAPELEANPFLRMLLLGSALTLQPPPLQP